MPPSSSISALLYPFGLAAESTASCFAPDMLQVALQALLSPGRPEGMAEIARWVDVPVPRVSQEIDKTSFAAKHQLEREGFHYRKEVTVAVHNLADEVAAAQLYGRKPLTIGGDHSQGLATIKATLFSEVITGILSDKVYTRPALLKRNVEASIERGDDYANIALRLHALMTLGMIDKDDVQRRLDSVGVIWFDSHGDCNTVLTTPSGNAHGMSLAASLGLDTNGLEHILSFWLKATPRNVYIVGSRDLDAEEQKTMDSLGVHYVQYDARHIRTIGSKGLPSLKAAIKGIMQERDDLNFVMSLDVDGIDARYVPTTGTPVSGGPSLKDAVEAFTGIANDPRVLAIDITEANIGAARGRTDITKAVKTMESALALAWHVLGGDQAEFEARMRETDMHKSLYRMIKHTGQNAAIAR